MLMEGFVMLPNQTYLAYSQFLQTFFSASVAMRAMRSRRIKESEAGAAALLFRSFIASQLNRKGSNYVRGNSDLQCLLLSYSVGNSEVNPGFTVLVAYCSFF